MTYCVNTAKKGTIVQPNGNWNGFVSDKNFEILGISDSDYAKDVDTRRSISGFAAFLNDAVVVARSKMQQCVTLSVTEAELVAATMCVQETLYVKHVLDSMDLKVTMPMLLTIRVPRIC